ncbi:nitrate/nitrite two-component sensor kinase [Escherichia coli]|nr:nitrate/nitrite two-component sensor kinase [Escherichia coli]
MLKRCLSPLTLVNQVALIVLLSTAIGLAGMAVSGWLVQGVQGSAHAINKAGSLRMQSYRLLAAVPLSEKDKPLIKEMEQTAFSAELTRAAERDGQLAQLQGLQDYWRNELIPALMRAQNRETVSADVSQFVAGLDQLVSGFDRTTEMRIETVVLVHRVMAVFMALLLVFTIIWLRARLLQPWRQLLAMASAVSHRDFTQRAKHQRAQRNGDAWNCIEQYVCRTGRKVMPYLSSGFRRKLPGWSIKIRSSLFYGRLTAVCIPAPRCVNACHRYSTAYRI